MLRRLREGLVLRRALDDRAVWLPMTARELEDLWHRVRPGGCGCGEALPHA